MQSTLFWGRLWHGYQRDKFVGNEFEQRLRWPAGQTSWMKFVTRQGWVHGVPRQSCTARLAAGCTELEPA